MEYRRGGSWQIQEPPATFELQRSTFSVAEVSSPVTSAIPTIAPIATDKIHKQVSYVTIH
jgi:hypothetical protein